MAKVYLRIYQGITTKKIDIPEKCLNTTFRVPILEVAMPLSGEYENWNRNAFPINKYMEFQWDLKSTMDASKTPVMDLINIENK